jgi:hypothetical protein
VGQKGADQGCARRQRDRDSAALFRLKTLPRIKAPSYSAKFKSGWIANGFLVITLVLFAYLGLSGALESIRTLFQS